ncbi:amidohydrolase family protein [Roseibium aggregatum]|uniref:Amidohydrolase family protein n=1 Tax=Roseibium aggregatum TaxID=187304 RepID=A0A926P246_9HYPH|nr:amidohydrolase family protein [Roseibium aggregatum]MBD1548626.1 amidohydrolase family protein [Roseibium aggregatum]
MTGARVFQVADALLGAAYEPGGPLEITVQDGLISAIEPLEEVPSGTRLLAMPALADAHNHARPISTTSFGCGLKPLETWLPSLVAMPSVDPYLATAAAFGRSVRGGCVGAMAHLTRPMGLTSLPEEAKEIARAASDAGLKIGLAIAIRDRNPLVYGDHEPMLRGLPQDIQDLVRQTWLGAPRPSADQIALVETVADAVADMPGVDVQYGPNGVQWCTDDFLTAIAEASERTGRRVHMHLLETLPQRTWADQAYPQGIVRHLADIGLLSPRLTLAHCVWARPDELELIAEYGARISVNPSSNLHLASGIAPVAEMKKAGVAFAMGLDGCAFDEDDDALRELRLFRLLNAGWSFAEDLTPGDALKAACSTGRAAMGLTPGGTIEVGQPADLMFLDLDALDRDGLMPVDPRQYLFARAKQDHIVELVSGGRTTLQNGKLTGLDLEAVETELRAQYRAALPTTEESRKAFAAIEPHVAEFYKGCC